MVTFVSVAQACSRLWQMMQRRGFCGFLQFMFAVLPSLIGVIHLRPLPGSPCFNGDLQAVVDGASADALALAEAGFEGIIVENFGDMPFVPGRVAPLTTAVMTSCALSVRAAAPDIALGINVLRNDAEAALAIAIASGADFIRINVHTGARLCDQGLIEGKAHETLRRRREYGAERIRLFCDVDVKHSAPLAPRPIAEEAEELVGRGLSDAVLVTGSGTGKGVSLGHLQAVMDAVRVPVYVASGVTLDSLGDLIQAHGVIVGSCLRRSGRAGERIDAELALRFADVYRRLKGTR